MATIEGEVNGKKSKNFKDYLEYVINTKQSIEFKLVNDCGTYTVLLDYMEAASFGDYEKMFYNIEILVTVYNPEKQPIYDSIIITDDPDDCLGGATIEECVKTFEKDYLEDDIVSKLF
jgi:hypothetical protein